MFPHSNYLLRSRTAANFARQLRTVLEDMPRGYGEVPRTRTLFETIDHEYSDEDFRLFLRLSRNAFDHFVAAVDTNIEKHQSGKSQIHIRKQCMIFLKYLGSQDTLLDIATMFGVSNSAVHLILRRILRAVIPSLSEEMIRWPNENEARSIMSRFHAKWHFPVPIIGAIDCRENPILPPSRNSSGYYNRKCYHSIKLQAVVDADGKFMDVFVGWPGRSHDGRCFANSPIYTSLETGVANTYGGVLLGDSAYPLRQYLLTPFKGAPRDSQKSRYNTQLSKCRQIVECAFGQLSERWRRLKLIHLKSMDDIISVCIAACTMHNFCKLHNEEDFGGTSEGVGENEEFLEDQPLASHTSGRSLRQSIVDMF